jgi:phosphoserine phosphatase
MSLVATLICNPANPALESTIVEGMLAVLPQPPSRPTAMRPKAST